MYGDDCWGMMLWANYFRNKVPKKYFCKFLVLSEKFRYPDFLPKLLSVFGKDAVLKLNWLFSPSFDSLILALLFFLSYFLSGNLLATFLASLIYILFPPLVFQMSFLHARALGYLLFNFTLILIIFGEYFGSFLYLIAGCIFGGLLLNTHVFSTQALVFVILGLFLLKKNVFYIAALTLIFLSGIVLSKGFYFTVLSGHLKTIRTHYRNIRHNPYEKFNFKSSIIKSSFWGFVIALINLSIHSDKIHPLTLTMLNWAIVLFIIFILTTFIVPLRTIGQGYRYMEFAIVPISILFSSSILQYSDVSIFILLLFALYVLFAIKKIYSHYNSLKNDYINIIDSARLKMFEFIKSNPIENIFCIPSGMSQGCAYFTGKKILWTYYNWDNYSWLFPEFTLPLKFDLSDLFKKYNLDAVLLHRRFARREELKADFRLIHQEGQYLLLGLNRQ